MRDYYPAVHFHSENLVVGLDRYLYEVYRCRDPDVFDYQAFISYRHRPDDSALAQWLVEAIETFETPDRLQQEGYPAKIGKVFRDEDVTSGLNLS